MKKLLNSRALRQGSAATVITVLAIVLAVVINLVVGALADRFGLSLDLTAGSVFSLSDDTRDFINGIDKEVDITVFTEEETIAAVNQYYRQVVEMMNGFARSNPNINVTYVDILKNPNYTAQYPDLDLNSSSVLFECEGRVSKLSFSDMFNTQIDYNTYQTYITSSKAEQSIASAILNVTTEDLIRINVIEGHNEAAVTDFVAALELNGFTAESKNLMTDELDPEADILIMCAPARDITEDEAAKLETFLDNGGRLGKTLFYMAGATQPEDMPILANFLASWGIGVEPGVVYETNQGQLFQMNVFMTLANYAENEYSADVKAKNLPFGMANSRPLKVLFETKSSTSTTTLLEFSAGSGVMPADAAEDFFEGDVATTGPHPALVLAQKLTYDQTTPLTSSVLVAGSNTAVDPAFIGSSNFANSEYLTGLLSKLAGREQTFSVQNKTIETTQLGITAAQVYGLAIVFVIVIPVLVLAAGIVIWLRRRHR